MRKITAALVAIALLAAPASALANEHNGRYDGSTRWGHAATHAYLQGCEKNSSDALCSCTLSYLESQITLRHIVYEARYNRPALKRIEYRALVACRTDL